MSCTISGSIDLRNLYIAAGFALLWLYGWKPIYQHRSYRGVVRPLPVPFHSVVKTASKIDYLSLIWESVQLSTIVLLYACLFPVTEATNRVLSLPTISFSSIIAFWVVFGLCCCSACLCFLGAAIFQDTVYDQGDEMWMDQSVISRAEAFYWIFNRADMIFAPLPAFFLSFMVCEPDGTALKMHGNRCWKGAHIGYACGGAVLFILSYWLLLNLVLTRDGREMEKLSSTHGFGALAYVQSSDYDRLYQDKYSAVILQIKIGVFMSAQLLHSQPGMVALLNIIGSLALALLLALRPPNFAVNHTKLRIALITFSGFASTAVLIAVIVSLPRFALVLLWLLPSLIGGLLVWACLTPTPNLNVTTPGRKQSVNIDRGGERLLS